MKLMFDGHECKETNAGTYPRPCPSSLFQCQLTHPNPVMIAEPTKQGVLHACSLGKVLERDLAFPWNGLQNLELDEGPDCYKLGHLLVCMTLIDCHATLSHERRPGVTNTNKQQDKFGIHE